MKYEVFRTNQFNRSYEKCKKRGFKMDELKKVVELLANGSKLPEKYRDHNLTGNNKGYRECHIRPDWLLVYKIINDKLILVLQDTGSHSDLF